jgi:hypothetical protein
MGTSATSNVKMRLFTPPNVEVGSNFALGVTCRVTNPGACEYRWGHG